MHLPYFKILIVVLLLSILAVGFSIYGSLNLNKETTAQPEAVFVKTFGPGESPHSHLPDPQKHFKIKDIARAADDVSPPLNRKNAETVEINLEAKEVIAELAPNIEYLFFTYNGKVPGPFLRVREGDTVKIVLSNPETNTHIHSVDLHSATGPGGGGKIQVAPGETKDFTFKALIPGIYIYHSASGNVGSSMANGAYGLMLVEPKSGLEKADREFYVVQGEFFTQGPIGSEGMQLFSPEKFLNENPTYVVFNGRVNSLVDNALSAKVGEKIRIYFGNAGVTQVSSFHIIGEIFDKVFLHGSFLNKPMLGVQTTLVPAGGAAAVELNLDYPGDFILVDHSLTRLDKGAFGVLRVEGKENPEIFFSPYFKKSAPGEPLH